MKYGITKRNGNVVIVLPDGTGLELKKRPLPKNSKIKELSGREAEIVNRFVGELPRMLEAEYKRPEYRNVVLEID